VKSQVRFLALGEAGLGLVGLIWISIRSIPINFRFDTEALSLGILAATVFSVVNLGLYGYSRRLGHPAQVHAFLENELFPVFRRVGRFEIILLALLAGFGEEIFFRGALQQETGLWVASFIFGILHGPSKDLWPLGLWAAVMGVLLGVVYESTGNLVVPAVAHAAYDGVALFYVKKKFRRIHDEVREDSGFGE
jgi:membrane protease YdiL (CAAX protease family)